MANRSSIFPTFFLSGFECSTFDWKDQGRRDLAEETQHYGHADEDYAMLASLGVGVAREAIPWPNQLAIEDDFAQLTAGRIYSGT